MSWSKYTWSRQESSRHDDKLKLLVIRGVWQGGLSTSMEDAASSLGDECCVILLLNARCSTVLHKLCLTLLLNATKSFRIICNCIMYTRYTHVCHGCVRYPDEFWATNISVLDAPCHKAYQLYLLHGFIVGLEEHCNTGISFLYYFFMPRMCMWFEEGDVTLHCC